MGIPSINWSRSRPCSSAAAISDVSASSNVAAILWSIPADLLARAAKSDMPEGLWSTSVALTSALKLSSDTSCSFANAGTNASGTAETGITFLSAPGWRRATSEGSAGHGETSRPRRGSLSPTSPLASKRATATWRRATRSSAELTSIPSSWSHSPFDGRGCLPMPHYKCPRELPSSPLGSRPVSPRACERGSLSTPPPSGINETSLRSVTPNRKASRHTYHRYLSEDSMSLLYPAAAQRAPIRPPRARHHTTTNPPAPPQRPTERSSGLEAPFGSVFCNPRNNARKPGPRSSVDRASVS